MNRALNVLNRLDQVQPEPPKNDMMSPSNKSRPVSLEKIMPIDTNHATKTPLKDRLFYYKIRGLAKEVMTPSSPLHPSRNNFSGIANSGFVDVLPKNYLSKIRRRQALQRFRKSFIKMTKANEQSEKKSMFPIDPASHFKKLWETVKVFILLYQCYYLPVSVTFLDSGEYIPLYVIDKVMDLYFLVDLILNFVTMYYHKHDLESKYMNIAMNYLKSWFLVDFLAIIPAEDTLLWVVSKETVLGGKQIGVSMKLFKFVRLIRLTKFFRLFQTFNLSESTNFIADYLNKHFINSLLLKLLPSFLLMITFLHCMSCCWFIISILDSNGNWIILNKMSDWTAIDLYVACAYFVLQTFTSVGYGDALSTNNYELSFRILLMILGGVVYGMFSGQIIEHRTMTMEKDKKLRAQLQALDEIRSEYSLNETLFLLVSESLNKERISKPRKYDLNLLPPEDKNDLLYMVYMSKFRNISLFSNRESHQNFVIRLGNNLQKREYERDSVIYLKDTEAAAFYVIFKGTVGLMINGIPIHFVKIESGFFGEYELIMNTPRQFTAVALTDCILYSLNSPEFKRIILTRSSQFCRDFEYFAKVRQFDFQCYHEELHNKFLRKLFWRQALMNMDKQIIKANMAIFGLQINKFKKVTKQDSGSSKKIIKSKTILKVIENREPRSALKVKKRVVFKDTE